MRRIVPLLLVTVAAMTGHVPNGASAAALRGQPPAVAIALAHVDAWSHHNWDKARQILASDVHVTVTTTQPTMARTDTIGIEAYMDGLKKFAQGVVPGSAHVIASVGDDRNALVMLTVTAALGPGGAKMPLTAARLYLLDDQNKIKAEQVIYYVSR